ncbi:helix-turn-helix transcriptional regulator [Actinophytocola glycyrrhizae]|uniref:Response regulator transcription factor n=1 Tax=Actinophytocola glycyrrhizae TaxID=2044873 RepID=A0ABV9S9Z8_9PSEU
MSGRIPVHVHATDAITRSGLRSQLRHEVELDVVDRDRVGDGTVLVVATDTMDEDTLRQLRELNRLGGRNAVLVTSTLDDAALLSAIEVGICALVPRSEATPATLTRLVVKAARGEATLPSDVLGRLLRQVSRLQHNVLVPRGLTVAGLSPRETDVLRLVADGLDTDEIAESLSYSSRTVKNILYGITSRFCLRNRSHAVAYALREGYI